MNTGPFNTAKYWNLAGRDLLGKKEYPGAIEAFNKAIAINPAHKFVWNNLGTAFGKCGRYEDAISAYQTSIEYYPDYVTSWCNLGKAHLQCNNYHEAIVCFDQVLESGNRSLLKAAMALREEAEQKIHLQGPVPPINSPPGLSYPQALDQISECLSQIDAMSDENWIIQNIPNGPQLIRGIAGSGKTLTLCQKAAYIHAQHPDCKIAVVFFSQSLYRYITRLVQKYCRLNGVRWSPEDQGTLEVLHSWGGQRKKGFYSELCNAHGLTPKKVNDLSPASPPEMFAMACRDMLKTVTIQPSYDVILLDEAQDFVVDDPSLLYENRQPVFWLCYMALRPFDPVRLELRRLIWAFDEYQTINSLKVPTAAEIFGNSEKFRNIMKGKGRSYIMDQCYRTPKEILMAAHALGMGLYFREGMLSGPTTKDTWEGLGYEVTGAFKFGNTIELSRNRHTSPNPISWTWNGPLMNVRLFSNREEEYARLAQSIRENIDHNGLSPDDILVVSLVKNNQSLIDLSSKLWEYGITNYISATAGLGKNNISTQYSDTFSLPNAVTVSGINRAKGNEGNMVYIVGLDAVGEKEGNIHERNRLFIAMTRSRAWIHLSGIGDYGLYHELRAVMEDLDATGKLKFVYKKPPQWCLDNLYDPESTVSYQSTLTAF
ncbi:hypothetical protein AZH53_09765 [Methanomicrobiaceae archaeon CYW5]|uniref:tetratricopeptide repeat protein n=1 Tax=Methanovulcanius yangii TaxID=1789227 RepID=UPI0029CA1907|nr:tetratricopeptide repeat protein [Methanovulcanius yangii]MBT8508690.1 hypothetical protein [Methanovulcanius yangii]